MRETQLNKMKCINCNKIFTITKKKGKVGFPLCPYCLTINQIKNVTKKQRSSSNASTPYAR